MWKDILVENIKRHEGYKLFAYDDATGKKLEQGDTLKGKLTIGYGHNLSDKGISDRIADMLLEEDIKDAYLLYLKYFPEKAKQNLTDYGVAVVVEMFFNIGMKVLSFKKMIQAIIDKDPERASKEMLDSKWARQVGHRAEYLAELMKNKGIKQ